MQQLPGVAHADGTPLRGRGHPAGRADRRAVRRNPVLGPAAAADGRSVADAPGLVSVTASVAAVGWVDIRAEFRHTSGAAFCAGALSERRRCEALRLGLLVGDSD